jgi:hypothetical protein
VHIDRLLFFLENKFSLDKINQIMSFNSASPVATESNVSSILTTACDDRTCSTAKCALCLHCSQQYCFVHFLKHNEQLSLNAYNFTLAIDQLGKLE